MKKKKLCLSELKISSFVTGVMPKNIIGGATMEDCSITCPIPCGTAGPISAPKNCATNEFPDCQHSQDDICLDTAGFPCGTAPMMTC